MRAFREHCPAPILSLERWGEERVDSDFHASPDDPEQLLKTVAKILTLVGPSQALRSSTTEPQNRPN